MRDAVQEAVMLECLKTGLHTNWEPSRSTFPVNQTMTVQSMLASPSLDRSLSASASLGSSLTPSSSVAPSVAAADADGDAFTDTEAVGTSADPASPVPTIANPSTYVRFVILLPCMADPFSDRFADLEPWLPHRLYTARLLLLMPLLFRLQKSPLLLSLVKARLLWLPSELVNTPCWRPASLLNAY
jgi:hypothetical protein